MKNNFRDDKEFEEAVNCQHYPYLINLFSRLYSTSNIRILGESKKEQMLGDVELYSEDGGRLYVELKMDRHVYSSNIFLEDVSNSETETQGCTLKTQADILSYGFYDENNCVLLKQYVYEMQPLKKWYLENRNNYPIHKIKNFNNQGNWIYNTLGRAVPRKDVRESLIGKNIIIPDIKRRLKQYIRYMSHITMADFM